MWTNLPQPETTTAWTPTNGAQKLNHAKFAESNAVRGAVWMFKLDEWLTLQLHAKLTGTTQLTESIKERVLACKHINLAFAREQTLIMEHRSKTSKQRCSHGNQELLPGHYAALSSFDTHAAK